MDPPHTFSVSFDQRVLNYYGSECYDLVRTHNYFTFNTSLSLLTCAFQIQRPVVSRFIRIYDSATDDQVVSIDATSASVTFPPLESDETNITFVTTYNFRTGRTYYILLDAGMHFFCLY